MIDDRTVLALIPARAGSKGIHRKNTVDFCGKPLLAWPINAAKDSQYVDRIILSTDEEEIAYIGEAHGAEIPFIRPSELAADSATSFSVVEHAIRFLEEGDERYDYLVFLEPTSPLTSATDIDSALNQLHEKSDTADSIVGVSQVICAHPQFDVWIDANGLIRPYLGEWFGAPVRRQELDKLYFFDGSLYISKIQSLLATQTFYHDRTLAYVVPKWKSIEIDDEVDLICAEAIMSNIGRFREL